MNMNTDSVESQIEYAATEAVYWHQLPTNKAINFIIKQVRNATPEQAEKAVKNVVVSYKNKAIA